MNTAPLTEVRDKLRQVVDNVVDTGAEYVITRHGKPVAVVLAFDEYESLLETLNILSDAETVAAIDEGEADLAEGD
jgi:prevent-host-death family protein